MKLFFILFISLFFALSIEAQALDFLKKIKEIKTEDLKTKEPEKGTAKSNIKKEEMTEKKEFRTKSGFIVLVPKGWKVASNETTNFSLQLTSRPGSSGLCNNE
ncbi:MAG: hypothetical protein KAI43_10960 [Candidatus Aureabacteria bacterium]|nr:hypothetical protein [Candidatus Auribacterota bacterium]